MNEKRRLFLDLLSIRLIEDNHIFKYDKKLLMKLLPKDVLNHEINFFMDRCYFNIKVY